MGAPAEASGVEFEVVVVDDNDDDDSIDDDQLKEYGEELGSLENFPDKVTINLLSMVAEDYSARKSSSEKIYRIIRRRLLGCSSPSHVLPVVYVLDSILKNAKGAFIQLVENDAQNWLPAVHGRIDGNQKQKLQKVWKMWNDCRIFDADKWKAMGKCFNEPTMFPSVAGVSRTKDGKLIMPTGLRKSMQSILDEIQEGEHDELKKVSLERLATIDENLFGKIKQAAMAERSDSKLSPFATRKPQTESTWSSVTVDPGNVVTSIKSIIAQMHDGLYEKADALQMTQFLSAAAVTADWLETTKVHVSAVTLELENRQANASAVAASSSAGFLVSPTDFTNDGIKKRNPAVVALLYEIGLPYVSSADGRRFRTQLELSNHIDDLFRKKQISKVMAVTQERGWYVGEALWCNDQDGLQQAQGSGYDAMATETTTQSTAEKEDDTTFPEDENRDHCVVCGKLFKLVQKNDDYVYDNCREINVLNDDAAATESEDQLVHVSCWKGLGEPHQLTFDQTIQT